MKVIYAIVSVAGWIWLLVVAGLLVIRVRHERPRRGFDVVRHNEL